MWGGQGGVRSGPGCLCSGDKPLAAGGSFLPWAEQMPAVTPFLPSWTLPTCPPGDESKNRGVKEVRGGARAGGTFKDIVARFRLLGNL